MRSCDSHPLHDKFSSLKKAAKKYGSFFAIFVCLFVLTTPTLKSQDDDKRREEPGRIIFYRVILILHNADVEQY